MDTWKKCVLSAGKTMSVKFPFFGGGFWGGGGSADFIFMGARIFLIQSQVSARSSHLATIKLWAGPPPHQCTTLPEIQACNLPKDKIEQNGGTLRRTRDLELRLLPPTSRRVWFSQYPCDTSFKKYSKLHLACLSRPWAQEQMPTQLSSQSDRSTFNQSFGF